MAQMPASYLTEKVDDLRADLARLDTAHGVIEMSGGRLLTLASMVVNAQAIIDEIKQWTAEVSA